MNEYIKCMQTHIYMTVLNGKHKSYNINVAYYAIYIHF